MKDIITQDNKLLIKNGNFVFTKTKKDYILQKASQILKTVAGEDLQNINKGLDLQGIIFNEKVSTSDIYAEILRNLLLIEEIEEVANIEIEPDQDALKINCSIIINGQIEEIQFNI